MTHLKLERLRQRLVTHAPERATGPGRIEAAVAIVLVPTESDDLELLFIKRAEEPGDPWSGQMALPGGRREEGDSDLLTTARRETLEETDVTLQPESLLGELDDLAPVTPVLPPVVVRPFVFGLEEKPSITASPEVALYVWTSLGELGRTAAQSRVTVRGADLTVPSYLVGPHIVWGMTHRIISRFIDLTR
jgi:8-oxo-dGTP pyrophosphatase MutT (NUDIX family)